MKKMIIVFVLLLFTGLVMLQAEPINVDSQHGWKMLTIPLSPSVSAMAGTGALSSGEAGSFIEMPTAGLIGGVNSLSVTQNLWIFDTQMNSIAINTGSGVRSFGFAMRALDYGKIDSRDIDGEVIGEFHPLDLNLIANFAYRVTPNYYAGVNLMLLYQKIHTKSSTGVAADLGLSYITPLRGLIISAALKHVGMTTVVDESRIKLPVTPQLAFSYDIPVDFAELHAESKILKHPDDSNAQIRLGLSAEINRVLNLRTGYHINHDTQSYTAGIGLQLKKIDIDYAYLPFGDEISDAHTFGVTYKF